LAYNQKSDNYLCSVKSSLHGIYTGTGINFSAIRKNLTIDKKILKTIQQIQSGDVEGKFIWKASDPSKTMHELIGQREVMISDIEGRFQQQPNTINEIREATEDYPEKIFEREHKENEKVRKAVEEYIEKNKQRSFKVYHNRSLRFLGKIGLKGRPVNAYWPRNNSRMDVFLADDMELGWEVIQRIDEVGKGFIPDWQKNNPDAVLLHSLRKNDEVEIWHDIRKPTEERKRILARVQKMSEGDIFFCPVEVSAIDNKSPNHIRIRSLTAFKKLQLTQVIRNALGIETFRSRRRNW
jgi:hypothetical protein